MTKQLYEEALADVKKLKEVAEDNAKRALLEAVTPRIRDLIENQLLGELGMDELEADPDKLLTDELPSSSKIDSFEHVPMSPVPGLGDSKSSADSISVPDEEGKVTLDLDSLRIPSTEEYELSMESVESLGMLMKSGETRDLDNRIKDIQRQVSIVASTSKLVKETRSFSDVLSTLISEVEDTYSYLQANLQDSHKKSSYESILENHYSTLKQLMEQKMKKRLSTLSEADVTLKLTGMPDELDLDSIGVDLITGDEEGDEEGGEEGGEDLDLGSGEGEEGDDEESDELDLGGDEDSEDSEEEGSEDKMESRRLSDDTIVEIDENMLRREIGRMKALREAADMPKNAPKGNDAGEVADGFEDDDLGDPFTDINLREGDDEEVEDKKEAKSEVYELDELEEDMDEMDEMDDMDEMDELDQAYGEGDDMKHQATDHSNDDPQTNKQNRMPEALRRKISAELAIQTEAKKKATMAKKKQTEQQKKAQQAKKMQEKQQAKKQAKKMAEAYNFYATKFNESVARSNKLKGMLAEAARKGATLNGGTEKSPAAETDLRNKLAETNLFNAKLLFTNKLLQNESLTKRQKAEVIERLDEAKNEREVKLVYESLIKTLAGSTNKITESADRGVMGSSSRPARPASATNTLNEGFESDRWARLAGIVK
jgi:hypothetical protein